MGIRSAACRWLALMLMAVTSSLGLPVQSHAADSHIRDPVVGPHARDEAQHKNDVLRFTPARTGIERRHARPAGRPAPGASPLGLASAGGALTREVFGFAPYWALSVAAGWNYSLLSTLAYFGLDLNADGNVNTGTRGWTGWNSQELVDMINRAHLAGDRVVVVIKAFDNNTICQLVNNPASTQGAINSTIAAIRSKNLDVVNVDFEVGTWPAAPTAASRPPSPTPCGSCRARSTSSFRTRW
jgi:hypothetical protein